MPKAYFIKWGDMYLHSITKRGTPLWTMDFEECRWFSTERASKLVKYLESLHEGMTGLLEIIEE